MPSVSNQSSSSKKKTVSKPSTKHGRSKYFKSDEVIRDSDEDGEGEGVVKPPTNGAHTLQDPKKANYPARSSLTLRSNSAISNGHSTKKPERDVASSVQSSDSQSEREGVGEIGRAGQKGGRREGSNGIKDDVRSSELQTGNESGGGDGSTSSGKSSDDSLPQTEEITSKIIQTKPKRMKSPPPYEPPPGFCPATISPPPDSSLTNLFSPTSLRNKQIWHIIVPSSVRIKSLTEFSTKSVQAGTAILSHKGTDYGLILQPRNQNAKKLLLLPCAEVNEYTSAEAEIARTLQLQQIVPKGAFSSGPISNGAATGQRRYEKAAPQQPEGLRMRYRPIGDTGDSAEESEAESQPERPPQPPQFRQPLRIDASPSRHKKNDEETHDNPDVASSEHKTDSESVNVRKHNGMEPPPSKHKRKRDNFDDEMQNGGPDPPPSKHHKRRHGDDDIEITAMDLPAAKEEHKNKKHPESFQTAGLVEKEHHHHHHHHPKGSSSPAKQGRHPRSRKGATGANMEPVGRRHADSEPAGALPELSQARQQHHQQFKARLISPVKKQDHNARSRRGVTGANMEPMGQRHERKEG